MEIFRSDVKSGIFIVVAVIICLVAIFKVGDIWERFHPGTQLILHFDHAQQASPGTAVFLLGRKVGRAEEVRFSANGMGIDIIAKVDDGLPLWQGTQAQIIDKSLLGGKIIELVPPPTEPGRTPEPLDISEPIPGLPTSSLLATLDAMSGLIQDFRSQSTELFANLNRVLANLDRGIDDTRNRVDHATELIPKLEQTVDEYSVLANTVKTKLSQLIDQMSGAVDTLVPATTNMESEIETLAQQLQEDFRLSREAVESALDTFETLSKRSDSLVLKNQAELTQAIEHLNDTLAELEDFSRQIAERPSRVIWSRKRKSKNSDD